MEDEFYYVGCYYSDGEPKWVLEDDNGEPLAFEDREYAKEIAQRLSRDGVNHWVVVSEFNAQYDFHVNYRKN